MDAKIHTLFTEGKAIGPTVPVLQQSMKDNSPKYTTDLNEAMSLIPAPLGMGVGRNVHHYYWQCHVMCLLDGTPKTLAQMNADTAPLAVVGAAVALYKEDFIWGPQKDGHKFPHFIRYRHVHEPVSDWIQDNIAGRVRRGCCVDPDRGVQWGLRFETLEDMALFKLKWFEANRLTIIAA
jgi:hypothetical protein